MIKVEKINDGIDIEINGKGKVILCEFEALTEQMVETVSTSMSMDKAAFFIMNMVAEVLAKKILESKIKRAQTFIYDPREEKKDGEEK